MESVATHCKNAAKAMVLVKSPQQENPIAVIFVVVVGRGEPYEIDFDKNSSKRNFSKNVPVPDWGIFKSSRALPEPI